MTFTASKKHSVRMTMVIFVGFGRKPPDIYIKEHLFGLANFSGVDPDDAGLS